MKQYLVDLLKIVQFRRKSTMNAENLVIYNCCDWETIEALNEFLPELQTISSLALVIKSVHPGN